MEGESPKQVPHQHEDTRCHPNKSSDLLSELLRLLELPLIMRLDQILSSARMTGQLYQSTSNDHISFDYIDHFVWVNSQIKQIDKQVQQLNTHSECCPLGDKQTSVFNGLMRLGTGQVDLIRQRRDKVRDALVDHGYATLDQLENGFWHKAQRPPFFCEE